MADPRLLVDSHRKGTSPSLVRFAQRRGHLQHCCSAQESRSISSSDRELQQGPSTASLLPMNITSAKGPGIVEVGCAAPERDQETVTSLASAHNNADQQSMWDSAVGVSFVSKVNSGADKAFCFSWNNGCQRAYRFSVGTCLHTERRRIRQHDQPQPVQ